MQCHHCHSEMHQTDYVIDGPVRQTWYHCPLCGADETVVCPEELRLRRVGNAQRCSSGLPANPPFSRRPF